MSEEGNRSITLYSYRKVWFVEKKIYAIQNITLPFPVNPYEVLEFLIVVGVVLLLSRMAPVVENVPVVLRYAVLPYVTVKYLMKLKLDGKNPVKYFCGLIPYLFHKKCYIEHFRVYRREAEKVKLNWFCSKG